jgi:hypothetical protein
MAAEVAVGAALRAAKGAHAVKGSCRRSCCGRGCRGQAAASACTRLWCGKGCMALWLLASVRFGLLIIPQARNAFAALLSHTPAPPAPASAQHCSPFSSHAPRSPGMAPMKPPHEAQRIPCHINPFHGSHKSLACARRTSRRRHARHLAPHAARQRIRRPAHALRRPQRRELAGPRRAVRQARPALEPHSRLRSALGRAHRKGLCAHGLHRCTGRLAAGKPCTATRALRPAARTQLAALQCMLLGRVCTSAAQAGRTGQCSAALALQSICCAAARTMSRAACGRKP